MSSDQAIESAFERFRRKLAHKLDNPEAQAWLDINDRNNLGPAFFIYLDEIGQSS